MKKYALKHAVLGLLLLVPGFVYSAKAVFLITPLKRAPVIVYSGQTTTIVYKVINNTPFSLNANQVATLPAGIKQATGGCGKRFNLAKGRSCLLYLTIKADQLKGSHKGAPLVCSSRPVYCSRPSAANELNIVKRSKPAVKQTLLSVNPVSFNFLKGGATQIVTITNKGTVNANGLSVKLAASPALGIKVSNNCPASLSYLAPKNTCQLKFTSGSFTGTTTAVIAATNSTMFTERITVNEQQAKINSPTHSLELTFDPPGNVGEIKLTNDSSVIANKIRVVDFGGADGALTPNYSNCDTVARGEQCTINLTALKSLAPTKIKIQGTNTDIFEVEVTVAPASTASLEVNPDQIDLTPGGFISKVTLKNNSPADAEDLSLDIQPDLGLVINATPPCSTNSIFTLPRNSDCEFTFTPGNQFGESEITINGSNISAPVVIKVRVNQAEIKFDPAPPQPFSIQVGSPSSPIRIVNESDTTLHFLGITIGDMGAIQVDPSSGCQEGMDMPGHSDCSLVLQANAPEPNVQIDIKGQNSNVITMFASAENVVPPHIWIAPDLSERLLDLDDPQLELKIKIQNDPGSQETDIIAELPTGWSDVHIDVPPECHLLQGGDSCVIRLSANNASAVNLPGVMKITGTNNANVLLPKIATQKGGGVVFYADGAKAKVAYKIDNTPELPWQTGTENGINTDFNDGETNTNNIIAKLGAGTDYAAGLCNSLTFMPDGGSAWYLPALCELGYNLSGNCLSDQDMASLLDIDGLKLDGDYWSSTESNPGDTAWAQHFPQFNQMPKGENQPSFIRCVRSFSY